MTRPAAAAEVTAADGSVRSAIRPSTTRSVGSASTAAASASRRASGPTEPSMRDRRRRRRGRYVRAGLELGEVGRAPNDRPTRSGMPPVRDTSRCAASVGSSQERSRRASSRTASASRGPGRRTVVAVGSSVRTAPRSPSPGRRATKQRIRSARSRRRANRSACAEDGSIHWASSIATMTTPSWPVWRSSRSDNSRRPTSTSEQFDNSPSPISSSASPNATSCSNSSHRDHLITAGSPCRPTNDSSSADFPIPDSPSIMTTWARPDRA